MSPRVKRYITMLGLISGTMVSIAGVFTVFGFEIPKFAFKSDLVVIEKKLLELDIDINTLRLTDARLQLFQNGREREKWKSERGFVPEFLIKEKSLLEAEIKELERRIEKIRENDI